MQSIHQELLESLMKDRNPEYILQYIADLENRIGEMQEWVKYLKVLYRRKTRKPVETGIRGGK